LLREGIEERGYYWDVPIFATARESKEYLVGRIVEEARRVDIPLSEIETKMMYFSEKAWTLPDIWEMNEAFDREYDQAEYEEKIAGLIRSLRGEARKRDTKELAEWEAAVRVLRREDHYLLVMIDVAGGRVAPVGLGSRDTSLKRLLKLFAVGFGLFLVCSIIFMGVLILKR
jgi:hypothetical protein